MLFTNIRSLFLSRWFIIPAAIALGTAIGSSATAVAMRRTRDKAVAAVDLRYAHGVTAGIPLTAYEQAIVAASLERGDSTEARQYIRNDLRLTLYTLAERIRAWGGEYPRELRTLRSISTYYERAPDPDLEPDVKNLLSQYPAYSQQELAAGACNSSICRLGTSTPTTQPSP